MKKQIVSMLRGLLLIGLSGSGFAGGLESGNDLLAKCRTESSDLDKRECRGYIKGNADTYATVQAWEGFPAIVCFSEGVGEATLELVVLSYLMFVTLLLRRGFGPLMLIGWEDA